MHENKNPASHSTGGRKQNLSLGFGDDLCPLHVIVVRGDFVRLIAAKQIGQFLFLARRGIRLGRRSGGGRGGRLSGRRSAFHFLLQAFDASRHFFLGLTAGNRISLGRLMGCVRKNRRSRIFDRWRDRRFDGFDGRQFFVFLSLSRALCRFFAGGFLASHLCFFARQFRFFALLAVGGRSSRAVGAKLFLSRFAGFAFLLRVRGGVGFFWRGRVRD